MQSLLIKFSPALFWDIDRDSLNFKKHRQFVIERVLKFGDSSDWQAIKQFYGLPAIKKVAQTSRDLDDKSRNFWRIMLKIK
ncbi:MAG: hypothetical protein WC621_00610 [Patescibacteria group bacterium]